MSNYLEIEIEREREREREREGKSGLKNLTSASASLLLRLSGVRRLCTNLPTGLSIKFPSHTHIYIRWFGILGTCEETVEEKHERVKEEGEGWGWGGGGRLTFYWPTFHLNVCSVWLSVWRSTAANTAQPTGSRREQFSTATKKILCFDCLYKIVVS